ncbi:MAG TPA: calcium-binding protein [Rhizomicrobium sp.]|jgi:Ca2+-binding RTX toxin-like protein
MNYKGTAGNDDYTGTSSADTFNMTQGGDDTVSAGGGDDIINYGNALNANDKIDGGTGNDTLELSGDAYAHPVENLLDGVVNISKIVLGTGFSYELDEIDSNVAGGATMTIDASALGAQSQLVFDGGLETDGKFIMTGGAGDDILEGGAGDDVLIGNDGNDILIGGGGHNTVSGGPGNDQINLINPSAVDVANGNAGDDLFFIESRLNPATQINGGAGSNTMTFSTGANVFVTCNNTTFVNIQTIYFEGGGNVGFVTADGNVAAGATLVVNATALTSSDKFTFNGSAETDGSFNITGGPGIDTITGGAQADSLFGGNANDVLVGGGGNDTLFGGLGKDMLTGGAGHDTFQYASVAQSSGPSFDIITDFSAAQDKFALTVGVAAINPTVTSGKLDSATFNVDLKQALGAAQLHAHDAVLFTPTTGSFAGDTFLVVDANGTAGYQAGADYVFEVNHLAGQLTTANFG